jgi:hypothetical protein
LSHGSGGLFSVKLTFLVAGEIQCIVGSEIFVLDSHFSLVSRVSFTVSGMRTRLFAINEPAEVTHGPPAFWVPNKRTHGHQVKALGQKIFVA